LGQAKAGATIAATTAAAALEQIFEGLPAAPVAR
jgi:hypothetical protein